MSAHYRTDGVGDAVTAGARPLMIWRVVGAVLLLAMGGIHLYLVLTGFSGLVGTLFLLNAIGGLVLAVALVVAPRRFLSVTALLSLLFMVGTLLGLVIALTPVGLLGVHEKLGNTLVPQTLVVESIGSIVLLVTTVLAFRMRRAG